MNYSKRYTSLTPGGWPKITFVELFDAQSRVETPPKEAKEDERLKKLNSKYLTYAARLGLRLPARGGARSMATCPLGSLMTARASLKKPALRRRRLARTMLRNVIAESDIASGISQVLQEKIIRSDPSGEGTILDFYNFNNISIKPLSALDFESQFLWKIDSKYEVLSALDINFTDVTLRIDQNRRQTGRNDSSDTNNDDEVELPPLVTAWLIILHDILTIGWGSRREFEDYRIYKRYGKCRYRFGFSKTTCSMVPPKALLIFSC